MNVFDSTSLVNDTWVVIRRPLVNTYCRLWMNEWIYCTMRNIIRHTRLHSAHAIAFLVLPSRRLPYVLMSRSICIFCLRVLRLTVLDMLLDSIVVMCVCCFVPIFRPCVTFRLYFDDWLSNPKLYSYFVVLILDFIISVGLHPIVCSSLFIVHSYSDFTLIGFLLLRVSALSLLDFISSEAREGVLRHN